MDFLKNQNKKGFTLIELLVVIAIIGVLSSIAVVNLSSTTQTSKKNAMLEQMKNIVPLVDTCFFANEQVCSDCLFFGGSFYDIDPGKQICGGQVWPEPIDGWNWGVYHKPASNQWSFDAGGPGGSSFSCSNNNVRTACTFFQP